MGRFSNRLEAIATNATVKRTMATVNVNAPSIITMSIDDIDAKDSQLANTLFDAYESAIKKQGFMVVDKDLKPIEPTWSYNSATQEYKRNTSVSSTFKLLTRKDRILSALLNATLKCVDESLIAGYRFLDDMGKIVVVPSDSDYDALKGYMREASFLQIIPINTVVKGKGKDKEKAVEKPYLNELYKHFGYYKKQGK